MCVLILLCVLTHTSICVCWSANYSYYATLYVSTYYYYVLAYVTKYVRASDAEQELVHLCRLPAN
jgi:hypothetical protein